MTAKTRRILEKFVIFLAVIILSVVISAVEFYMKILHNRMCLMTLWQHYMKYIWYVGLQWQRTGGVPATRRWYRVITCLFIQSLYKYSFIFEILCDFTAGIQEKNVRNMWNFKAYKKGEIIRRLKFDEFWKNSSLFCSPYFCPSAYYPSQL